MKRVALCSTFSCSNFIPRVCWRSQVLKTRTLILISAFSTVLPS